MFRGIYNSACLLNPVRLRRQYDILAERILTLSTRRTWTGWNGWRRDWRGGFRSEAGQSMTGQAEVEVADMGELDQRIIGLLLVGVR